MNHFQIAFHHRSFEHWMHTNKNDIQSTYCVRSDTDTLTIIIMFMCVLFVQTVGPWTGELNELVELNGRKENRNKHSSHPEIKWISLLNGRSISCCPFHFQNTEAKSWLLKHHTPIQMVKILVLEDNTFSTWESRHTILFFYFYFFD